MAPKSAASPASSASTYESSSSDEEEEVAPPPPPKSAAPKPFPAAAPKPDSSDDESESGSSDVEAVPPRPKSAAAAAESGSEPGSESDDEPPAAATLKLPAAAASSGDESGSGDESDSDSDAAPPAPPRHSARVADPAVKPLASKPMPPKPAAASDLPAAKQFHRIWSDEDELTLLTGILNYKANTGIIPSSNSEIEAFKDFIHKSLRVEVTTTQIGDKVRHLKKKHDTRLKTPSPTFAKPHDAAVYELSQKVWGAKRDRGENGDVSGSRVKKRRSSGEGRSKVDKKEVAVVAVDEGGDAAAVKKRRSSGEGRSKVDKKEVDVVAVAEGGDAAAAVAISKVRYPYFTDAVLRMGDAVQSGFVVKEAIESVDDAKARLLESKYKKLKLQQIKSNIHEMDLNKEALKAVMDAMAKFLPSDK